MRVKAIVLEAGMAVYNVIMVHPKDEIATRPSPREGALDDKGIGGWLITNTF